MSKKLFVLEGPDRTGKTTLAKFLIEFLNIRTNVTYFHCDFNKKLSDAMLEYQTSVVNNLIYNFEVLGNSIVIDRLWLSNVVYGTVLRNQTVHDWNKLREKLRTHSVVYVFTDCALAVHQHSQDRDPEHPYTDEQFESIVAGYERLYKELRLVENCVHYDMHNEGKNMTKFAHETLGLV